jgi:hypothetical protein
MKNQLLKLIGLAVALLCAPAADSEGSTEIRVLESWPDAERVVLAPNQNFYLRLAYETEVPVSIWIRPYFRGKPVNVGSNPSPTYQGSGEAIGWFFFMNPDEVDEIRIIAGDGSAESTPVAATWHGQVIGGRAAEGVAEAPPAWVTEMLAKNQRAQEEAYRERMSEPTTVEDVALFNGFMLTMLAIGVMGFAAPGWGLWRWRGAWRLAAAVPAAVMAFVVLRILWDGFLDPTSHNLWPFEILMAGAFSAVFMAVLKGLRKLFQVNN